MALQTAGNVVLRVLICIAVTWVGVALMGLIGLAMTAPIWGVLLAKPILEFFPGFERWIHRRAFEEWEGKYYKYERTHLRVYFDGDTAWFVADDILAVLGKKPHDWLAVKFTPDEYGTIPDRTETGFTPEGVVKLAHMSAHPDAGKFRVWFERAVIFTLNRKKEMQAGG